MSITDRILPLEAIDNFRDYGDYLAGAHGRLPRRKLFRSAHHARATAADLQTLADLDVAVIVDLRRPLERDREPSPRPPGFAGQVIECDLGDQAEAPHVAFLRETDLTPESARRFFLDYYANAPFEARHGILFRRYFEALAQAPGAVLIHCTAGKDRTGLLAALTHHVMGVHPDDMRADYLLTNQAARLEERLPMVTEALEASLGRRPSETAVRAFLGVQPEYLDAAFAAIEERCGGIDPYLDEIGVDAAARDRVRARLAA
ncbi:MAG: tyrosine-protein phosphatase [Phenylobacterium sp.]|uniref:tyrosine-protein phosphatase n=1 Tax=Phenylobacterium sp. TaxID=1871053 RepID=UPI00391DDCA4